MYARVHCLQALYSARRNSLPTLLLPLCLSGLGCVIGMPSESLYEVGSCHLCWCRNIALLLSTFFSRNPWVFSSGLKFGVLLYLDHFLEVYPLCISLIRDKVFATILSPVMYRIGCKLTYEFQLAGLSWLRSES